MAETPFNHLFELLFFVLRQFADSQRRLKRSSKFFDELAALPSMGQLLYSLRFAIVFSLPGCSLGLSFLVFDPTALCFCALGAFPLRCLCSHPALE